MLTSPITFTLGAASISLHRTREAAGESVYFGKNLTAQVTLTIRHLIPKKADQGGEQHMIRANVARFDAQGVYIRTDSVWFVLRSADKPQDDALVLEAFNGLSDLMNANTDEVANAILDRRG